jgi:carbamoyl-phosphate synthase large subunit
MDDQIKVLMTGAGAPGGPGVMAALMTSPMVDLYVCDANPNASGRYLIDGKFHLVPKATDDFFIDKIMEICLQNEIRIVFPLVTLELFEFAKHKNTFASKNINIIVSEQADLNIANNKGLIYSHLLMNDIDVPKFSIVRTKNEFISAAKELGYPKFPIVMKPSVSNGSRGVRILDEHLNRYDLLFKEKPLGIFSRLNDVLNDIGERTFPNLVISEYLPGAELTIDTIVDDGNIEDILIRTRNTINSGISTSGTFINNDAVANYIKKIVKILPGLKGPIGFQVKESTLGGYLLLECNPRIQGTSVAAMGLGVNLPLRALMQAAGISRDRLIRKQGISFSRYYQEVFYES